MNMLISFTRYYVLRFPLHENPYKLNDIESSLFSISITQYIEIRYTAKICAINIQETIKLKLSYILSFQLILSRAISTTTMLGFTFS